jgi:hypothetical protein
MISRNQMISADLASTLEVLVSREDSRLLLAYEEYVRNKEGAKLVEAMIRVASLYTAPAPAPAPTPAPAPAATGVCCVCYNANAVCCMLYAVLCLLPPPHTPSLLIT